MPVIENLLLSIGAMKAGTSWLYMLLRDHPQIDAVPLKEIHYFAQRHTEHRLLDRPNRLDRLREMTAGPPATWPGEPDALLAWFRAYLADPVDDAWLAGLFHDPHGPAWCAEFSNLNALLPPAGWQHVRRAARRVRVLYTLRHPLARLWSHTRFHLAFTGGFVRLADWGEAEFKVFLALPEIADYARYARVLAALEQNLDADQYHLIIHDEIESAPRGVLAGIEAFLGIPAGTYDPANLVERHNSGPRHAMPRAFAAAARPMIERELAALDARSFTVPAAWRNVPT